MIFDIERMAQTPGVIDVATISGGEHDRRPGKGIDEAIARLGAEPTALILQLVDASLKTASGLGWRSSIRLYTCDLSVMIESREIAGYGVESIAITLVGGHPQTNAIMRTINRCWADRKPKPKPAANEEAELGQPRVLNPDATEAAY